MRISSTGSTVRFDFLGVHHNKLYKLRAVLMHRPQYFIKRLVDERKNAFIPG